MLVISTSGSTNGQLSIVIFSFTSTVGADSFDEVEVGKTIANSIDKFLVESTFGGRRRYNDWRRVVNLSALSLNEGEALSTFT